MGFARLRRCRGLVLASITAEQVDQALTVLLKAVVNPALAQVTEPWQTNPSERIAQCIERVRIEASEGASLVAACAPHGRAMLTQAQQTLERLESLQVLAMELAVSRPD